MDRFARLSSEDRRRYFEEAAARLGLSAQMIEKDFWVCWTLKHLFSLSDFHGHLTFKGGTTLSKVYHVVERFSEDLDISIERAFLGFGDDKEPERAASGKEQQRRIARLQATCRTAIAERLMPQLHEAISSRLGDGVVWSLVKDQADRDEQTLLFLYPPAVGVDLSPYFAGSVKIEIGARSDHFPTEDVNITSYLVDVFPDALTDRTARVRVLAAERTFWEKATILHMLHFLPRKKKLPPRMSRHYYDFFRLVQSRIFGRAMSAIKLLDRVAVHKSVFFKTAWAHYETAHPDTLQLTPSAHIIGELRQDYIAMQPMFFGEPPPFEEILAGLPRLQEEIRNHAG
jgi:hypothetical protein